MKITIFSGIVFIIGIAGNFMAKEAIKAKPLEYGIFMMAGGTNGVTFFAQYGIYIGLMGLGLSILSFIIKSKNGSVK